MKLRHLILLFSVVLLASCQATISVPEITMTFQEFKDLYEISYPNPGIQRYREIVFYNTRNLVNAYNRFIRTEDQPQMNINFYSDLSEDEFLGVASGSIPEDEATYSLFLRRLTLEESIKNVTENIRKRQVEASIQEIKR